MWLRNSLILYPDNPFVIIRIKVDKIERNALLQDKLVGYFLRDKREIEVIFSLHIDICVIDDG